MGTELLVGYLNAMGMVALATGHLWESTSGGTIPLGLLQGDFMGIFGAEKESSCMWAAGKGDVTRKGKPVPQGPKAWGGGDDMPPCRLGGAGAGVKA